MYRDYLVLVLLKIIGLIEIVHAFLTKEKNSFALVHDVLSYNTTGFMICCYMVEKLNLSVVPIFMRGVTLN